MVSLWHGAAWLAGCFFFSLLAHSIQHSLVCLMPNENDPSWSVNRAAANLQTYVDESKIMRHFLEPSIRAPKRFVAEPTEGWAEALLKIRSASPVYSLVGNAVGEELAARLWPKDNKPKSCLAVLEIEIELLTGRTHQIRGQLSAAGYPLVGDAQYSGALPIDNYADDLALQCCELEFLDPDEVEQEDGTTRLRRSDRWNRFRLEKAWWSPWLKDFTEQSKNLAESDSTTSSRDVDGLQRTSVDDDAASNLKPPNPDILPPRASLAPGRHKYVLIRAVHPLASEEEEWFVKSASPAECGGPYHGNVAQDLREWIEAAGYEVTVTGGGRIWYDPDNERAVVYGFSYGFGRGDHEKAASLIKKHMGIDAVVDNNPDLY